MREDQRPPDRRYETLKQRLWNQPRALKFLEPLERHGARPALLERVAELFSAGQHGEAEIQAAIYYNLLRHRDRADLLRRVADLRAITSQLRQDLLFLANEFSSIEDMDAFGLSNRMISALTALRETPPAGLELFLQRLAGEYRKRTGTHFHRTESTEEGGKIVTIIELKKKADLRQAISRTHRNLLRLIRDFYLLRHLKGYQTAGYAHFSEFAEKEIGLSGRVAGGLVIVRKQIYRIDLDTLLQVLIKECCGPNQKEGHGDPKAS
ncbi:hypothetical protein [Candidatus Manganitrophus noduliformans]|uniref:Uncharacterized protein n=1 Tax=Candidatus Manganitrophus noduliformans TaxID=2606439 RepID=A0A7X6DTL7_9BACT|nr:hypothetical protein [Candidatus Manganitrophus noduliformans]NKE72813.1 hypothetical protein [Candidatus Manganitrophus noduliformans]